MYFRHLAIASQAHRLGGIKEGEYNQFLRGMIMVLVQGNSKREKSDDFDDFLFGNLRQDFTVYFRKY